MLNKLDSVLTGVDIIGDVSLWIVPECEPIEDISDKLEVRVSKVFDRDVSVVAETSEDLGEIA